MVATAPKTKRPTKGTKALTAPVEFKLLDEPGAFRATFSRFNIKDYDGDVTLPGAFTVGQPVRIAQWGHNWGEPAIGKGVIGADGERAWVEGKFNLSMAAGKETYEAVKELGALQQWSYGYSIKEWSVGEFEGDQVRFLRSLDVHEISPVMLGAQPLTSTDEIKGRKAGRRNSAADESALRSALDALTSAADALRQVLGETDDDDDTSSDDDEGDDGKAKERGTRTREGKGDAKAKDRRSDSFAAQVAADLLGDVDDS